MAASIRNSEEETPAKKIKLTNEEDRKDNSDLHTFRGFQLIKVLNENAKAKTVCVHGERLTFQFASLNLFNLIVKGIPAKIKRIFQM